MVFMPVQVVQFSSLRMVFALWAIILVPLQIMKMDWLALSTFFRKLNINIYFQGALEVSVYDRRYKMNFDIIIALILSF